MVLMHSIFQEDHGGANLKMSSCMMDSSGALLIGGTSGNFENQREALFEGNRFGRLSLDVQNAKSSEDGHWVIGTTDINDFNYDDDDGGDDFYDHGGNNDGDDNFVNGFSNQGENKEMRRVDPSLVPASSGIAIRAGVTEKKVATKNTLQLLDPFETVEGSKKLRKGKCYKIPECLRSNTTSTSSSSNNTKMTSDLQIEGLSEGNLYSVLNGNTIHMKGLSNPCFNHILKEKKRLALVARLQQSRESRNRIKGQLPSDFLYRHAESEDQNEGKFEFIRYQFVHVLA